MADLVTVRIHEFLEKSSDFKPDDELLIWDSDIDKTRKAKLSNIRSFILSDGGSTIVPTQSGATVLYVVGAADAGGKVASIPSLAGQFFSLRRGGQPMIPEIDPEAGPDDPGYGEFAILVGGGFKLKGADDELYLKERFELTLASASGGSTGTGSGSGSSPFIKGVKQITTNFTLTSDHLYLLIQIRLGNTAAALTLPNVASVPGAVIPVEALINNNTSCKILTQGGQYIYFRNTSINNASTVGLYILPGEQLWFYAGEDGWYVINPQGNWGQIGRPFAAFEIGLNEISPIGQTVPRTGLYARLWEFANSLPYSLVDDAVWQTASVDLGGGKIVSRPYRGCFSRGTAPDNFRLPDFSEMTIKGLAAGADPLRYFNHPGGFQKDMVGAFTATITGEGAGVAGGNGGATNVVGLNSTVAGQGNPAVPVANLSVDTGNTKTTIENLGMFWVLKY